MPPLSAVVAMLRTDAARLSRDRFLLGIGAYIVAISLAMRWAVPWVTRGVAARWGVDLVPYHPLIVSHFVVQLQALLVGILGAFLLLESREDRTVRALIVSPVGLTPYLVVVGAVMAVASAALTVVEGAVIGIALPAWPGLLGAAVAGAGAGPVFAFLVGAVSDDKTEAFAWLKIVGLAPMLASGAWFLSEPLQWIAGVYPPYWAAKAYWVAEAGGAWGSWALAGVVWSGVCVVGMARLYVRAARR